MIEILLTAVGAATVTVIGNVIIFYMQRKASKEDKEDLKLIERIETQEKEQAIIKSGLNSLLYDRLYRNCRYHLTKGKISATELKNIEYLYNSYHVLGGNGTGTTLFERVSTLPIEESDHD